MKDKVLVKLIVPEIDKTFDLFVPVNEIIWKIKKLMIKSISDITNIPLIAYDCSLISKDTGKIYANNQLIIDTDIRNGSEIVLLFRKNM